MTRRFLIPLLALTAVLAGCDDDTGAGPGDDPVTTVTVGTTGRALLVGDTLHLTAVATTADGSVRTGLPVAWESEDETYAWVTGNGATGVVVGLVEGTAVITATVAGRTGSATVLVVEGEPVVGSVEIAPVPESLTVGEETVLRATVLSTDGEVMDGLAVTWSVDEASVAALTPRDEPNTVTLTGQGEGVALVSARFEEVESMVGVTVLPYQEPVGALHVSPETLTVELGKTVPLAVEAWRPDGEWIPDPVVSWSTSDPSVATVVAEAAGAIGGRGSLTTHDVGEVTIRASSGGRTDSARISVVAPTNVAYVFIDGGSRGIWKGSIHTLAATVLAAPGGNVAGAPVAWSVDDPTVAEIDAVGRILGLRVGSTVVTAESGGVQGTAVLTVREWPQDGVLEVALRPYTDLYGTPVILPRVGPTTWTDSLGVVHDASLWIAGGSLTLDGGRYVQSLTYDVKIAGPHGILVTVEERTTETRGAVGLDLMDPYTFHLLPDGEAGRLTMSPWHAGVWVIQQKLGEQPLISWVWTME